MPRKGQNKSAQGTDLGSVGGRLGLGPVFACEWITSSRRWQGYVLRSSFVLLLLVALLVIWKTTSPRGGENDLRFMARLGEIFFLGVIGTQLTLVLLAAPAATAGAICLDRARGTLTHILVTDLSDAEIVLGKLAARLVPVLGLVACTLPMMELLTLLGGVDPDALLGAFVVTLGVALMGCSLALVFSLWVGKTHEALLGTYAVWGLWLLGRPMLTQLGLALGWSLPLPPRTADPFLLAFAPYWWPGSVSWSDYLLFLGVTSTISALLTALGILRLRSVCTREPVRRARSRSSRRPVGEIGRHLQSLLRWMSPSLERNPVLWREWHRSRPSRWARMVTAVYITLASVFSVATILSPSRPMAAWVNGLQVSVGLLILSVTAATSLAEERVRGSLDVLMTTPLSTGQIVLGKWLGTYRRVPLLAILPGLVIWGGVPDANPATVAAVVLMMVYVLCAGAAITSLGLAMATWFSRLGRAMGMTVSLFVLVTVGWCFLMLVLFGPGRCEGMAMGSPFFWAGGMSFEMAATKSIHVRNIDWAIFWLIVCALGAAGLLTITLASFDRCLGRIEDVFTRLARPSRRARIVATVYFSLGMILSLSAILWRATYELTIAIMGLQFTVGLLLLALTAAASLAEKRHQGSAGSLMTTGLSTRRIVFAK
ncbi:MAG TPA: ABC transporter permease, partial [Isosphaeraceae bacterium]|nr:ABC transporter permease [Isosphaeraceae bacterium]